jgi:hypothetical protein
VCERKTHNAGLDGTRISRHHSERRSSLGEILSPTKVSILSYLFSCILSFLLKKKYLLAFPFSIYASCMFISLMEIMTSCLLMFL